MNWFGLQIKKEINLDGTKILIGDLSVVLLLESRDNATSLINFYASILYFIKDNERVKDVFGLFLDLYSDFKRIKIKKEFLNTLSHANLIYILEGGNVEAYYRQDNRDIEFIGLELRTHENFWNYSNEETLLGLVGEATKQKKIIFGKIF